MIKLSDLILEQETPKFERVKLSHKFGEYAPFDEETMKLHYNKHYKGYTDKLNEAVKDENIPVTMDDERGGIKGVLSRASLYSTKLQDNAGGFYNHTLFFEGLNPDQKGKFAESELETKLIEQYGSMEKFIEAFKEVANSHFGSGWAWLIYDKSMFRIISTDNQDNPLMDFIPESGEIIMALDLWEHSYYLKFKNERPKYVDAFFKLVCWNMANDRYQHALTKLSY